MILGWILLSIGLAGFGLGAYWDLKTTEFPDWLPYSMIAAALAVRGLFSFMTGDFTIISNSFIFGAAFLGFGLLLYFLKQWGDGDAWLMGALGFLFPDTAGFTPLFGFAMPFQFSIVLNFFLVALGYLLLYAVVLGLRRPEVYKTFKGNMKARRTATAGVFLLMLAASVTSSFYLANEFGVPFYDFQNILVLPFLALFILVFLQYARAVESDLFKRKVKAKDLRVGDVIMTDKWRGITEAEVESLRKKGGEVWIKEGVRFAPVFLINLIVTLFVGGLAGVLFPM